MAVLAGVALEDVRQNYEQGAVEGSGDSGCFALLRGLSVAVPWIEEKMMVSGEIVRSREWCVFRNLVHAVYREARHFGPPADNEAHVTVSSGPLLPYAKRCRQARAELKSTNLYRLTAGQ